MNAANKTKNVEEYSVIKSLRADLMMKGTQHATDSTL